jgi:DNA recombination protein RmuC
MLETLSPSDIIAGGLLVIVVLLVVLLVRSRRSPQSEDSPTTMTRLEEISRAVSELERVFSVPQSRGAVGETLLSRLLEDWLPASSFELQYSFRDGTRVDAVVKLGRYLVPVDAKFPFEAAKRAMEKEESAAARSGHTEPPAELRKAFMRHVNDIAERYIRPTDGTLGFALMYIPSERVYQYVFVEKSGDLLGEAMSRGVVPVSPSTLFLYLQTVAYGLRGFAVSQDARALLSRFAAARTDSEELSRSLSVAGTHLKNLQKALVEVDERVASLRQKLELSDTGEEV